MVKKVKKFNYQKDLKKKWKKMKDKKNPKINTHKLEPFWDPNKSIQANYRDLGLSINPNQTLGIPKTKNLLNPEVMEIEKVADLKSLFITPTGKSDISWATNTLTSGIYFLKTTFSSEQQIIKIVKF